MRTRLQMMLMWCLLLIAGLACDGGSASFSKELDQTWRGIFRLTPEDGQYRWFGYPVDNYGVLTAYNPAAGKQTFSQEDFICDTWYCIGVADNQIPKGDTPERLSVNSFVAVGEGPPITLEQSKKNDLAFQIVLPGLAKVLDLDTSVDWKKSVDVSLTLGKAYKRRVRRQEYSDFIRTKSTNQALREAFTNGRLAYVAADIVVENVEATIKLKSSHETKAKATLDKAVGTVLANNSSVSFTGSGEHSGQYTLKIKNPVVLAVQILHQPSAGVLQETAQASPELGFPSLQSLDFPPLGRKQ